MERKWIKPIVNIENNKLIYICKIKIDYTILIFSFTGKSQNSTFFKKKLWYYVYKKGDWYGFRQYYRFR